MKECLLITLIVLIVLVISDIALFIVILSNNSKERLSLRIRLNEFEDKLNKVIATQYALQETLNESENVINKFVSLMKR